MRAERRHVCQKTWSRNGRGALAVRCMNTWHCWWPGSTYWASPCNIGCVRTPEAWRRANVPGLPIVGLLWVSGVLIGSRRDHQTFSDKERRFPLNRISVKFALEFWASYCRKVWQIDESTHSMNTSFKCTFLYHIHQLPCTNSLLNFLRTAPALWWPAACTEIWQQQILHRLGPLQTTSAISSQLSRMIARVYGIQFQRYALKRRLEKACPWHTYCFYVHSQTSGWRQKVVLTLLRLRAYGWYRPQFLM